MTTDRPRFPATRLGRRLFALLALFLLAAGLRPGPAKAQAPDSRPLLAAFLDQRADPAVLFSSTRPAERERLLGELRAFYAGRDLSAAWSERGRLKPVAAAMVEAIGRTAVRHGLDPAAYELTELSGRIERAGDGYLLPVDLLAIDTLLTARLLSFVDDLCCGRVDPQKIEEQWHLKQEAPRLAPAVSKLVAAEADVPALGRALDRFSPPQPEYRRLVAGLGRYRAIAETGGWPGVPEGETLQIGDLAGRERLLPLIDRLAAEGLLSEEAAAVLRKRLDTEPAALYDPLTARAVEAFQRRYGLEPDGKLGPGTTAEMQPSAADRVRQIELNLSRWRWLPRDLSGKRLRVNVASFQLKGLEDGRETLSMDVVVGKKSTPTPLFSNTMTYIEVNPYWNVPASIARQEILPKLATEPDYLARQGYEVVRLRDAEPGDEGTGLDPAAYDREFRIRQIPGRTNALGRIKFMFPNEFSVYLHDTPAASAFQRARRDLSHGCVRVSRPLDLADWVLSDQGEQTRLDVRQAYESGRPMQVSLKKSIPVYILYWTAFAGEEREVHFRHDLYGHDAALARRVAARTQAGR